jgi:hypothetical protein
MLVVRQNVVVRPDDEGDDVPGAATARSNPGGRSETQRGEH